MSAPTFVATGALASSGNALSNIGLPAGIQTDDILIMVFQSSNQAIATPLNATGGTWAEIAAQVGIGTAASAGAARLGFFWCRVPAGGTGVVSVTDTGNTNLARIAAYRGVKTTGNPWNAVTTMTATSGQNTNNNSITTTVNDCLLLLAVAGSVDVADTPNYSVAVTGTAVTNPVERIDNTSATGTGGGINLNEGLVAAAGLIDGSTNALRCIMVNSQSYVKCTVALEPVVEVVLPVLPNFANQPSNFHFF